MEDVKIGGRGVVGRIRRICGVREASACEQVELCPALAARGSIAVLKSRMPQTKLV